MKNIDNPNVISREQQQLTTTPFSVMLTEFFQLFNQTMANK